MDLSQIFNVTFLFALLNIIFINIVLSGDNAVVIAMAVRCLPPEQRKRGIMLGTAGAVLMRIGLTFIAARLLEVPLVKLLGGLLILWIAFKLLAGDTGENRTKKVNGLLQAITTILMADLVMSLDNVLGVAGASNGDFLLLMTGLATSIPIVIFASRVITTMMDRFPVIVVCGAAILGRVAGEMIASDPFVVRAFNHPGHLAAYFVQAVMAVGVVVAARVWIRYRPHSIMAGETESPFLLNDWDLR